MDEPCSALDPISTLAIEDLMQDLVKRYTIVIVTHNMQQAARVSHKTGFFTVAGLDKGQRYGVLVEMGETEHLFTAPERPAHPGLHHGALRLIESADGTPARVAGACGRSRAFGSPRPVRRRPPRVPPS